MSCLQWHFIPSNWHLITHFGIKKIVKYMSSSVSAICNTCSGWYLQYYCMQTTADQIIISRSLTEEIKEYNRPLLLWKNRKTMWSRPSTLKRIAPNLIESLWLYPQQELDSAVVERLEDDKSSCFLWHCSSSPKFVALDFCKVQGKSVCGWSHQSPRTSAWIKGARSHVAWFWTSTGTKSALINLLSLWEGCSFVASGREFPGTMISMVCILVLVKTLQWWDYMAESLNVTIPA